MVIKVGEQGSLNCENPPPPSVRLPSLCSVSPNRTKKENAASRGYPKGRSKKRREEARCATLTLPELKKTIAAAE